MFTIALNVSYSYQILNDCGDIVESNGDFDDLNECNKEAIAHIESIQGLIDSEN